jgi:RNA polymerase sigma-B factor
MATMLRSSKSRVVSHKTKAFNKLTTKEKSKLAEQHMGLVTFIAKKYAYRNEPLDDLIQTGVEGLLKAAERFNKNYGVKFSTYASPTVDGEIRHYLRDKSSTVKISRKLIELNARINRFRQEELQRTGSEPSFQEISRQLQVPVSRIAKAMKAVESHFTISLDAPIGILKSGSMSECYLEDVLGKDSFVEEMMDREMLKKAFATLSTREREIVDQHFFHDQIQEDLSRNFNVTQAQISRIINGALKKMKVALTA